MPAWQIVDLDRDDPTRRGRVVDPMELIGLVIGAVLVEWEATDDAGMVSVPRSEVDPLPGFYRVFEPASPAVATSVNISIRKIHLAPPREFAVTLPLFP